MRILIDGYNLVRNAPELAARDRDDLEAGREALLKALSAYRSGKGLKITVVFDGTKGLRAGRGRQRTLGIDVVFSAPGETADTVLGEMCRNNEADLLVSADREVASACASRDVTVIGPVEFWDRVEMDRVLRLKGETPDEEDGAPARPAGRRLSKKRRKDIRRLSRL